MHLTEPSTADLDALLDQPAFRERLRTVAAGRDDVEVELL